MKNQSSAAMDAKSGSIEITLLYARRTLLGRHSAVALSNIGYPLRLCAEAAFG